MEGHRLRSGVCTVNFEHISHLAVEFVVIFGQVNASWAKVNVESYTGFSCTHTYSSFKAKKSSNPH